MLAATDPANAYGALLDWPASQTDARPQRSAGALVVLHDGLLLGWLGRGDHPLLTFLPQDEPLRTTLARHLAAALGSLVDSGAMRALLVSTVDGAEAARSPLAPLFVEAGFSPSSHGLLRRATRRAADEPRALER